MKNTDNVTIIPPGEHSPLGPSSSKRGISCPGSVKASKGATDDESIYAAEGTAAHYLSELARNHNLPCIDWLEHVFVVGKYKFTVDDEMAESAQAFVDWCAQTPGTPLTEQRIDYSRYFPDDAIKEFGPAFGTLDDARLNDDVVAIKDFKHGKGVQEWAKENTQLMLQALGVLEDFGYLYDIKGFELGIAQPRLNHFDTWYISVEDLLAWAQSVIPAWAAGVQAGTEFKAGDWCKFCRIRKKCAVRANTGVQLMLEAGEFEDLDELETHALRARNGLQFVTTEQMVKILPVLDVFKAWIKDLEKRAISELMAGDKIMAAAWKLVEGRSNRKWNGSEEAVAAAVYPLAEPFEKPKLRSVSVLEKEIGKAAFKEALGEFVTKPPGKPKLVPIEDKRPAITNLAQVEFDNLDETDD